MEKMIAMIAIKKTEYDKLVKDQAFLECLESWGVDNWDGYYDARKEFGGLNAEDDDED